MKNLTLLLVGSLIITSEMIADDESFFGIDFARNIVKINNVVNNTISTTDETYNTINISLGTTNKDRNQYFSYSKVYSKQDISYESLNYNYDWILLSESNLNIYAGLNLGYGLAKDTNDTVQDLEYGFKAGFLYDLDKDTQINIGAKQTTTEAELKNSYMSKSWSYYIGVNRKFKHLFY